MRRVSCVYSQPSEQDSQSRCQKIQQGAPGARRGDEMTRSPLCGHLSKEPSEPPARPPRPAEGPASFTALRRQRQHSSLGHTFAREQRCVPSLRPLVSCSPLVQLFSHTPVIGWSLAVSLLLLSHSGASVVAVENRYPCLFFFVFTQIKIPLN